ncbi:MAG: D-Ala-D-Ala carboxypeptidase family metallohydrolase [Elainellaceae cyanobacterium]
MKELAPDQRNYFYLLEAIRVGIHKSILAALYDIHHSPRLGDGEVGLGIAPINRIPPSQLDTFPEQVQYAANTIRSLIDRLIEEQWLSDDLWNGSEGRYTDKLIRRIAAGYRPPASDRQSALLEASDFSSLLNAYVTDLRIDYDGSQLPHNLSYLDPALVTLVERLPTYFQGLTHQREAMLDAVRIWRNAQTREQVLQSLVNSPHSPSTQAELDELDRELLKFMANASPFYGGYPHQREALLRLTQLWRRLNTREEAIATLQHAVAAEESNTRLELVDPALISFAQRVPTYYSGKGGQRTALMEGFRLWNGLPSRRDALIKLGVEEDIFSTPVEPQKAQAIAQQIDRELVAFMRRIPSTYDETDDQRESLIRTSQIWRRLDRRETAVQALLDDVKRMEQAKPTDPINVVPSPPPSLPRPQRWTPRNIQISASIVANGNFTWAEATRGGQRMPPDQATVDAIVRIAALAQQARNRIGRPFHITSWYRPPDVNRRVGGAPFSRHVVGDAIDYYVEGMTGDELYRLLDPWWPGGLGRYGGNRRLISHLDARGHRARWRHA